MMCSARPQTHAPRQAAEGQAAEGQARAKGKRIPAAHRGATAFAMIPQTEIP